MASLDALAVTLGGASDRAAEVLFRLRNPAIPRFRRSSLTPASVDQAIAQGIAFLREHQRSDGSLRGFLLFPGASSAWMTAHVSFVLEQVPEATELCRRAAGYLDRIGREYEGWAWNQRSRIDVDSSALAVLVLSRFAIPVHGPLQDIAATQAPNGGFPTFAPDRDGSLRFGWQEPHPEVTAVVVEALRRSKGSEASIDQALAWLATQTVDGMLPSYWWEGWAYGVWIQSRIGFMTEPSSARARALLPGTSAPPDLAMLAVASMGSGGYDTVVQSAMQRLLRSQCRDGSWTCHRTLRVTLPNHRVAGPSAPGRTYGDRRRVFSTGHAVAALARGRALALR